MKKILLISSLFLVLFVDQTFGEAEEKVSTNGDILFIENEGKIPPVSPEDNEEIVPVYPPTKGPLSISYVPDIYFGTHVANENKETINALSNKVKNKKKHEESNASHFIQVNDFRGTGGGWKLNVKANEPLTNEKGTELEGASIIFSVFKVKSLDNLPKKYNPSNLYKEQSLLIGGKESITLAATNQFEGFGRWHLYLDDLENKSKNIQIEIPKNAVIENGVYSTNLTWVLEDNL